MSEQKDKRQVVQQAYASVAKNGASGRSCGCSCNSQTPIPDAELGLSCGDPIGFSQIRPGDVIVDLGSGAGKDVFSAAVKTGSAGRAIGVDMTDEMLELAGRHAAKFKVKTGLDNVEFRKGFIEDLPLESDCADLVISNCVINLSPDKPRVFREVYRVLKAGGKMVVSDIVLKRPLPEQATQDDKLYSACLSGALLQNEYLAAIRQAGFASIEIAVEKGYKADHTDPITGVVSDDLAACAASITVIACKQAK